jgi:hypothetical protein
MIFSEIDNFLKILTDSEKMILEKKINYASDQGVWQIMFYSGKHEIQLDRQNYIFFNLFSTNIEKDYTIDSGRFN